MSACDPAAAPAAPAPAAAAGAAPNSCGNGNCQGSENCANCPGDCGPCPLPPSLGTCGDGVCDNGEGCFTCEPDCGACPGDVCDDGTCGDTEDCSTCEPDCGTCTTDPYTGLLDIHKDDVRFGFAGTDNKSTIGGDSYGPDTSGPAWYWIESVKDMVSSGTFSGNLGIRNSSASDFRLVPLYENADKSVDNATIQNLMMNNNYRGNKDGLYDGEKDLYYYFQNQFPIDAGTSNCGDKFIIFMLSGVPNQPGGSNPIEWAAKLHNDLGVITYVVALTTGPEPELEDYADAVARAGGGQCDTAQHCAYIVVGGGNGCDGTDPNCDIAGVYGLAEKLGKVFSLILKQATSRTRVADDTPPILSTSDQTQWRVNAFFQTFPEGGPWRGYLRGAEVVTSGTTSARSIDFADLLNQRDAATRTILTATSTAASGSAPVALKDELALDYTAYVDAQLAAYVGAGKPCIAHAFFDSTDEWYRMLSGGEADNLTTGDCVGSADADMVTSFQGHKLGDIYHSSPVVEGPPELFLTEPSYHDFLIAKQDRPTMIYAGANDGMLHAFYLRNAANPNLVGQEAWAFVPQQVIESLPTRILTHAFYVDGTVIVRDVQKRRDSVDAQDWATVLVGGLGRGGAAYYALDVTDPTSPKFLWYFTDTTLAYPYSTPTIGRVFVDGSERPVAFLEGGYLDPATVATGNDRGQAFYVVDLFTGELLKRFSDSDPGSVTTTLDQPFTGSPTAFEDLPTTFSTRVFVGDELGRMWRVDTSSANVDDWKMTRFYPAEGDATYDTPAYQKPIFLAPSVALDPTRHVIVYYGTGNLENLDTVEPNYFFAVRELEDVTGGVISWTGSTVNGFPVTFGDHEKITGEAVVFNGTVIFTTYDASASTCGFGEGRLFGLDYLTGEGEMTSTGQLTFAGADDAVNSMSLGPGVPSTPVIRQAPVSVSFDSAGNATVTGGSFQALVQTGAAKATENISNTTQAIDLGPVERHADILSVVEIE